MNVKRYKLFGGDNACYGPVFGPIQAEEECEVPNSEGEAYLLLRLLKYFRFQNEKFEYFVVSPRYKGDTLETLRKTGCMVSIGRVLPGKREELNKGMSNKNTEYWSIGFCHPLDNE